MSIGKSSISRAEKAVSKNKSAEGSQVSATAVFSLGKSDSSAGSAAESVLYNAGISKVPVSEITSTYSESSIACGVMWKELVTSVEKYGIIEPLVLRKDDGSYRVIAGHKRLFAAKKLGIKEIEAKIIDADNETAAAIIAELAKFTQDSAYSAKEKTVAELSKKSLPDYLL